MKKALVAAILTLSTFRCEQKCAATLASATAPRITVNNTSKYVSGRYTWTVFLVADDATLENIQVVEYTLHPSFPNPVVYVKDRGSRCAFPFSSSSWGEFEVKVKISFKDGSAVELKHWLSLLQNPNSTMCDAPKPSKAPVKQTRIRRAF